MNYAFLLGQIPKAPELKFTRTGKKYLSFYVATKNPDRGRDQWTPCVVWGEGAAVLAEELVKDCLAMVSGSVEVSEYGTTEVKRFVKVRAWANNVIVCQGPPGGQQDDPNLLPPPKPAEPAPDSGLCGRAKTPLEMVGGKEPT